MRIHCALHKSVTGYVEDKPFLVRFDSDGYADVDKAVGYHLLRLSGATVVADDPVEESVQEIESPWETMTVAQLRQYAKDHDIKLGDARNRTDITAAIAAAPGGGMTDGN